MLERSLDQAAGKVLAEQWAIDWQGVSPYDLNRQMMLEALADRILYLLRYRHEKLLSALYILDIGERVYNHAMEQDTMEDRAWALAEAVYDRETEKIRLREKYAEEYGRGKTAIPEESDQHG